MANMTADVQRLSKNEGRLHQFGLVGYTNYAGGSAINTIYKGAIVMMDVSDIDGYVQPMLSTITAASGDVFMGIAAEGKATTSADTADNSVKIKLWTKGDFAFAKGALAVTDIGAAIYATDDQSITTTSTNALWIGKLVDVDDTYAWVRIDEATQQPNSAT